ncbi:hypothetical protein CAPTEDRAFT_209467 [Capitella teleta]|uniref:Uncharacterized protein n=1 Tax=Capitella teleta TaxID=283909 RepID=R7ULQ1_CAPTE|nr:hypothetical protein CAPTEDRAFT_209467 [Capitella teleta]|eukprot:ELU07464.1 hypothetical protein CAPTEDRAFT_209467 [Capitella teleta]
MENKAQHFISGYGNMQIQDPIDESGTLGIQKQGWKIELKHDTMVFECPSRISTRMRRQERCSFKDFSRVFFGWKQMLISSTVAAIPWGGARVNASISFDEWSFQFVVDSGFNECIIDTANKEACIDKEFNFNGSRISPKRHGINKRAYAILCVMVTFRRPVIRRGSVRLRELSQKEQRAWSLMSVDRRELIAQNFSVALAMVGPGGRIFGTPWNNDEIDMRVRRRIKYERPQDNSKVMEKGFSRKRRK